MDGTRHGGQATRISPISPSSRRNVCYLRKLRLSDAEAVFAYASDAEVTRYVLWDTHGSIEDSETSCASRMRATRGGLSAVGVSSVKANGAFVGTCGMEAAPEHARAELGYVLSPSTGKRPHARGRAAGDRYCFERMDLNAVEARCIAENTASPGSWRRRVCLMRAPCVVASTSRAPTRT